MLFLTESEVRRLLPMSDAIATLRRAFQRLARGEAANQPRRRLILPGGSVLHYMAGSDGRYFGAKIYSTNPRHAAHFLVLLYRAGDAEPLALMEANYLGQIRTGAASGLATDLMAAPEAGTVAIIGAGFQAMSQLEAVAAVRRIRGAHVWSRNPERRTAFAAECSERLNVPVEPSETAEQAVRGADILVTATSAREPVLEASWVSPGTHINAVGSNQAKKRELPSDLVHRADWIVVDSIEQSRMESGDLLMGFSDNDWNNPRLLELKDIVSGPVKVRGNPQEITLFKSNGLAIEDVASAGLVYERAREIGLGRPLAPSYS